MRQASGFSLAEMAIVLVIVGILMASGLGALSNQIGNQRIKEAKNMVDRANEALIAYALSHNHLPCPGDGANEDARAAGKCTVLYGDLPWLALGLPDTDPWGRRLKYRVSADFTEIGAACGHSIVGQAPCFVRTTAGDNKVKSTSGAQLLSASLAAAVVFSEGPNGDNSAGSANETTNRDGTVQFVQGTPDANFDDILVWLPTNILIYRFSSLGVWNN